jgi:DNA transformation protein and related proteins
MVVTDNMPVAELRNLGPATARLLLSINVRTLSDLAGIGAARAFRRLEFEEGRRFSLNLLYAMDGAISDRDWRHIDPVRKEQIKREAGR